MKILKRILMVLLVIVVIAVAVSFFLPAKAILERSAVMKTTPDVTYAYLNDLNNFNNWSPWHDLDPNAQYTITGAPGVGQKSEWDSKVKNVGKGSMTISQSSADSIRMDLQFGEMPTAHAGFKMEAADGGTKVTWYFEGADAGMNPIMRWMNTMMGTFVGGDYDKGIAKLQTVLSTYQPPMLETMPMDSTMMDSTVTK